MSRFPTNGLAWGLTLSVSLLLTSCVDSSSSANPVPAEVVQAAEEGLGSIPETAGKTLTLGEFFLVHTMDPDAVMAADDNAGSLIQSTGMWRVMVLENGRPQAMMTIDKVEGQWQVGAFGGAGIADELAQIRKAWPRSEGYELRMVRLYQARADVGELTQGSRAFGFVPLTSARMAFGMEKRGFDPRDVQAGAGVLAASKQAIAAGRMQ